ARIGDQHGAGGLLIDLPGEEWLGSRRPIEATRPALRLEEFFISVEESMEILRLSIRRRRPHVGVPEWLDSLVVCQIIAVADCRHAARLQALLLELGEVG